MTKRKNHKPAFKARVALEAIKGERTANVRAHLERLRSGGRNPPVFISILKIEE